MLLVRFVQCFGGPKHASHDQRTADGVQNFGGLKYIRHDQLTVDGMQHFGGLKCISHDQLAVELIKCGSGSGRLPRSCLLY